MVKWEYCEFNNPSASVLNELGKDGWELFVTNVNKIEVGAITGNTFYTHKYTFRRQLRLPDATEFDSVR